MQAWPGGRIPPVLAESFAPGSWGSVDLPQASWPTSELLPLCRRPSHGPGPRAAGAGSAHCRPVAPPPAPAPPSADAPSESRNLRGAAQLSGVPRPQSEPPVFPQRPGPGFPKAKSQLGDTLVPGTPPVQHKRFSLPTRAPEGAGRDLQGGDPGPESSSRGRFTRRVCRPPTARDSAGSEGSPAGNYAGERAAGSGRQGRGPPPLSAPRATGVPACDAQG